MSMKKNEPVPPTASNIKTFDFLEKANVQAL